MSREEYCSADVKSEVLPYSQTHSGPRAARPPKPLLTSSTFSGTRKKRLWGTNKGHLPKMALRL